MYFKDAPVPVSKIDPDQVKSVHDFKTSLGPQGGLYWTFEDTDQFERLVRIHLQRAIQEWSTDGFSTQEQLLGPNLQPNVDVQKEQAPDAGILDLTIEFSERFGEAGQFMQKSNSIMNAATENISNIGSRLASFGGVNATNIREAKALADEFSSILLKFDKDFSGAANLAADNVDAGIDAMIKFVELQSTIDPGSEEQIVELIHVMDEAQNHIEGYRDKISDAQAGLSALPPMTGQVKRAKRKLTETFGSVVERQNKSIELTKELKRTLFSIVRGSSSGGS